jgi:redox-sensing transcriptional repressor
MNNAIPAFPRLNRDLYFIDKHRSFFCGKYRSATNGHHLNRVPLKRRDYTSSELANTSWIAAISIAQHTKMIRWHPCANSRKPEHVFLRGIHHCVELHEWKKYGIFLLQITTAGEVTVIMGKKEIPDIVIGRLPIYLRELQRLAERGEEITSSHSLGKHLGISAAQIRKDLSQFGEFGKQGTGYNIKFLADKLSKILKVTHVWNMAVIGAGDVGHALARYQGFNKRGFHVAMIFDSDPSKIGKQIGPYVVEDASKMVPRIREAGIKIAMIAVPASVAQSVANKLVEAGVRAILNYAPISLKVPENVHVQYIDPVVYLQWMTYYL